MRGEELFYIGEMGNDNNLIALTYDWLGIISSVAAV